MKLISFILVVFMILGDVTSYKLPDEETEIPITFLVKFYITIKLWLNCAVDTFEFNSQRNVIDVLPSNCPDGKLPGKFTFHTSIYTQHLLIIYLNQIDMKGKCREVWGRTWRCYFWNHCSSLYCAVIATNWNGKTLHWKEENPC